jgi:hypothetical protein
MVRSACILIYRRFITNIFTQCYNHINCNWRKEFYVIYRHNTTLAAAVEIYVLVSTINFIIAFKYKVGLNFSWNMETGNYLQTYCNLYVYYDLVFCFLTSGIRLKAHTIIITPIINISVQTTQTSKGQKDKQASTKQYAYN